MNSAIESALLAVSASWPLAIAVKATLVMAVALSVVRLSAHKRAAFRHTVLAGAFAALLLFPIVSAVVPAVRITLQRPPAPRLVPPLSVTGALPAAPSTSESRNSTFDLLAAVWLAGVAAFLIPAAAGLWQIRRVRRTALPWREGQSVADALSTRRVDLLVSEMLPGPMTSGFVRPAIVLPVDAPQWAADDLSRAIWHEVEHVLRCDWVIHCVARAICALYWFHPLVWVAWRRLALEAERACDDAVLERSEPTAYADQLLAIARRYAAAGKSPLLAMASRGDLSSRVRAVLNPREARGRAGAMCVTSIGIAAVAVAAVISPLRLIAAPQAGAGGTAQIRTDTKLVAVEAKVTFPNGNALEGLLINDFEVLEDGVSQPIRFFEAREAGIYLLGYYSGNNRADGAFRKIEVRVKTATAAKVEHRQGYYATFPRPAAQASLVLPATPAPYDKPPVLIYKQEPEYSEAARKAKYQGTVLLAAEIDESGHAINISVIRSLGLGLDEKAIEAVKQWRFRPGTKNGSPVVSPLQLEVNFRLL